jgi:hypothetical protein
VNSIRCVCVARFIRLGFDLRPHRMYPRPITVYCPARFAQPQLEFKDLARLTSGVVVVGRVVEDGGT